MSDLGAWVFWSSTAVLAYAYVGFALLVVVYGRIRRRRVAKGATTPRVSLLVAAHNEEAQIAKKIENTLALNYPEESFELVIGSDGSDDATESIVSRCEDPRVRLLRFPRRGKMYVLNDSVPRTCGDVLVFSDANTMLDREALLRLVRNFADPTVGGVCGNQMYRPLTHGESSGAGERLYWTYDKWLKKQQTLCGSIVAADGAIYAIRRELFEPPPSAAVTDDFAISTAVVARGKRLVFESEALAFEPATEQAGTEFQRKVRIIVRGLRGVWMRRALLNPFRYGFYSAVLLSHKVLRRAAPLFLIAIFSSSALLASDGGLYRYAFGLQLLFYALAALGYVTRARPAGRAKILYAPFHYCLLNGAALVAIAKVVRGTRIETWQPQRPRAVG